MNFFNTITTISRLSLFITSLICLFNGIKHFSKLKGMRGLFMLCIFSTIDALVYFTLVIIKKNKGLFIDLTAYTQVIFHLLEILIILEFYLQRETLKFKPYISSNSILLFTAILLTMLSFLEIDRQLIFTLLKLVMINIFSVKYFFSNFNTIYLKENSFITISYGLFIFANITAPYYIIENNIESNFTSIIHTLNLKNELGYTILFFSINKEIRCIAKK